MRNRDPNSVRLHRIRRGPLGTGGPWGWCLLLLPAIQGCAGVGEKICHHEKPPECRPAQFLGYYTTNWMPIDYYGPVQMANCYPGGCCGCGNCGGGINDCCAGGGVGQPMMVPMPHEGNRIESIPTESSLEAPNPAAPDASPTAKIVPNTELWQSGTDHWMKSRSLTSRPDPAKEPRVAERPKMPVRLPVE